MKEKKINERGLAHALMVFMVLAWGFDYVPAKWAMEVMTPTCLMFFKFAIGAVFVLFLKFVTRNKAILRKKDIPVFIICALFGQIAYYECEYNAMSLMPVALITIILSLTPVVSILIERVLYKRKANRKIYFGMLGLMLGIVLVVGADFSIILQGRGVGYLLAFGAVMCWNIYNFITAGLKDYDSLALSVNQTVCSSLILIPAAIHSMPPVSVFSPLVIFGLLWVGLIDSGIGYLIVIYGLQKLGPTTNAVYSNFLPVTTAIFGAIFLGEMLTGLQIIGGVIVIAAGFIVIREKGRIDQESELREVVR